MLGNATTAVAARDDDDTFKMREIGENLFKINASLSQRNLRHF